MSRHPGNTSFGRLNSATQSSPFGQTNTTASTGLFGTQEGFRTGTETGSATDGTPVKFTPVSAFTTTVKQNVTRAISINHNSMAVMKEYKNKSLEKLRLEDDTAGMKGASHSGQTPGLFGATTQPLPFGQPNTTASTGLFGTQEGFRTGTETGSATDGTPVKFTPVSAFTTTVKQDVTRAISINHNSMAVMKEYKNKSLEKLRLEDDTAGMKGASHSGQTPGLFGATTQPLPFGQPNTTASTGLFGTQEGFRTGTETGSATDGTPVKFSPVSAFTTTVKQDVTRAISINHNSMAVMKEYKNKSLEKLRLEDDTAGMKGASHSGQTPGLFGATTQPLPFGQPNTTASTGLFGTQEGFRTGTETGSATDGTPVKFTPVSAFTTTVKQNVTRAISINHNSMAVMKEYKNKSLEKLRLEDDTAGMKGASQSRQTTSTFGQPQKSIQQTTSFGQANTTASTGLFGTQEGFRTGTETGSATDGTPVKFTPVSAFTTTVKQNVTRAISINHNSMAVMKEYKNKSLEKLRLEDDTAGMKGASHSGQTPGLFGATTQPLPFGQPNTTASTGLFGTQEGFRTGTETGSATDGTPVKFTPVSAFTTTVKQNVTRAISINHNSMAVMKEYKNKSLEKLRLEDDTAGMKGASHSGQTPGLFGATTQPLPFGQPNTTASTGLFGTQEGFRTGTETGSATDGTPVKFTPVSAFTTTVKQDVTRAISINHNSMAVMKEYKNKSLEKLRLEDDTAGMKGASQSRQTTSTFGQPQKSIQQTTSFGQANTTASTGLFGTQEGFRSGTETGLATVGTPVKFKPVVDSYAMVTLGVTQTISTKYRCITVMKEYKNKSLEELRLEDYTAGMKGPSQPAQTPGLSGQPQQSIQQTTPFRQTNTTASTGLFGTPNRPATGFGTMNNTQTPGFGGFGTAQPNQSIGLFNQKPSTFSMTPATANTGFGGFRQTAPVNTATNLFNNPLTTGFGTGSAFGTTPVPTFGTNTGFGSTQNNNTSLFNSSFKPAGQTNTFSFFATPRPCTTRKVILPIRKHIIETSSADKEINSLTNNCESSSNNSSPSTSTSDLTLDSGENVTAKTFDFILGQPKTTDGTKNFSFELKTQDQEKNALSDEKPLDEDESLNLILRCIESLNIIISKAQKSNVIGIFDNSDLTDKNIIKSALVQLRLSPERFSWINKCVFVNNQIPTSDFVIRKNIICTNGYDAQRYHAAIALSCLREDLKSFPNGDETVVGKTGLQLTDAQKEKLALARAFYANKDIYFLEDILNSVDSATGQNIFETSIKEALEDKVVIFITHNPTYLSRCDEIYVMKNGQINAQGSHESLLQSNAFYASKMNVTVDNNCSIAV
ncbi:uncharacterized protein LOC130675432 [Microplitis mediator]|uniref:uncharacterized protein LOC130675432 n=1 Tax=Microplitis mediator TaxID=375433 RepID=UPI002557B4C3|nr:uncharacterized protein LOC130675432 [Microplitis mediator]XP_057337106.1 uncharacterized protein LOC130675432 [Microplitis mediator]